MIMQKEALQNTIQFSSKVQRKVAELGEYI